MFKVLADTNTLTHEEWLEYRKLGIGGSDASVVCGVNRYKSPIELYMDKKGLLPSDEAGEPAYWGNQLESLVREEFSKRTGIPVADCKQILQSDLNPFMLANLDGLCQHPEYGTCIFEAKTASAYKLSEWEETDLTPGIPDEYMLQVQHYMAVTGYKATYIAVLIGGNTFRWKLILRDEELIDSLISIEKEFWEGIQSDTPPSLDGSDACAKFLVAKFPSSSPQSKVDLPATSSKLFDQYDLAVEKIAKYTEQKQEAENRLKDMLGDHEIGTLGNKIITWKSVTQERLDSKTLKSAHPSLFKKYANKSTYRRFSIKEAKE